jgi:hypothetical protein
MRFRPISTERLVAELAEELAARNQDGWLRVVLDGASPTRPGELADALIDPIRVLGRPAIRVSAGDFLRAASLRLEHGHYDPDAYYDEWLDTDGLRREVLGPLEPGGSGRILLALRDPHADRAVHSSYVDAPERAVLLLDGELLLGQELPVDYTVHLWLSDAALRRRLPEELHWRLPAYRRYAAEVDPLRSADTAVRVDDPEHPALRDAA